MKIQYYAPSLRGDALCITMCAFVMLLAMVEFLNLSDITMCAFVILLATVEFLNLSR